MKKLLLLCLLLGVSIGAFAQVDTLSPITPPLRRSPFIRDMERITSSRAYRITYISVFLSSLRDSSCRSGIMDFVI